MGSNTLRARRSELTTPANAARMIEKAAGTAADIVILDLEDACAVSAKVEARSVLVRAAAGVDWGEGRLAFRANPVGSKWFEGDVDAVLRGLAERVAALVVPKVQGPAAVRTADAYLARLEEELGLVPGGVALEVLVESPQAVEALQEIALASPRVESLIFGVSDHAALIGARLGEDVFTDYMYAKQRIVNVARAAGVTPIDCVTFRFRDLDATRRDAEKSRRMGFGGKWCVHPGQVDVVNAAFTPSQEEVAEARRIVAAYKAADDEGCGAIVLDDGMVDLATVRVAERVIALAQAAAARAAPPPAHAQTGE